MAARKAPAKKPAPKKARAKSGKAPAKKPAPKKARAKSGKAPAKKQPLKVVDAVERDLKAFAKRDAQLARSGLAASALALARELDDSSNSATSRSMCARALLDTLDRLRELLPPDEKKDQLDDLSARRAARVARRART